MAENSLLPTLIFATFLTFGAFLLILAAFASGLFPSKKERKEAAERKEKYVKYDQDLIVFLEHVNLSITEGKSVYDIFVNYKTDNKELSNRIIEAIKDYKNDILFDSFESSDYTLMKILLFFDEKDSKQKQISKYIKELENDIQELQED